jgi:hypothetical protein
MTVGNQEGGGEYEEQGGGAGDKICPSKEYFSVTCFLQAGPTSLSFTIY